MWTEDKVANDINRKLGSAFKTEAKRASKAILKLVKPFILALLPYILMFLFVCSIVALIGNLFTYAGTDAGFESDSMDVDSTTPSIAVIKYTPGGLTPEAINIISQYNEFAQVANIMDRWIVNPSAVENVSFDLEKPFYPPNGQYGVPVDLQEPMAWDPDKDKPYYGRVKLPDCFKQNTAKCVEKSGGSYQNVIAACSGTFCTQLTSSSIGGCCNLTATSLPPEEKSKSCCCSSGCSCAEQEITSNVVPTSSTPTAAVVSQTDTGTSCCPSTLSGGKACQTSGKNPMRYCCCVKDYYGREGRFLIDWKELYAGAVLWHSGIDVTTEQTFSKPDLGEVDVSTATKMRMEEDLHPYFFYKASAISTVDYEMVTTKTGTKVETETHVSSTSTKINLLVEAYTIKGWYQFNHKWVSECSSPEEEKTATEVAITATISQKVETTTKRWTCTFKEVPDGDPILVDEDPLKRLREWITSYYDLKDEEDINDYLDWFMYISKNYALMPTYTGTDMESYLSDFVLIPGESVWPVPGYYTITSPFGWRINPVTNRFEHHNGVDIAAPQGAPIIAAASCTVQSAGMESMAGLAIRCVDDKYLYLYGHTSAIFVNAGEQVQRGQTIALIGQTGMATGPHLHFAMMDLKTGKWVQPLDFISP